MTKHEKEILDKVEIFTRERGTFIARTKRRNIACRRMEEHIVIVDTPIALKEAFFYVKKISDEYFFNDYVHTEDVAKNRGYYSE